MKVQQFFKILLFGIFLAACGSVAEPVSQQQTSTPMPATVNALPSTETATVIAVPTTTAIAEPTTEPSPTHPVAASPTSQPTPEVEPHKLARQIIDQAELSTPDGWQVQPCEGEAPLLCIGNGQEHVGYAELLVFPLAGYDDDHPVRLAAGNLPVDGTSYTAEQRAAALKALNALADEHLDIIAADRAITYPDDTITPLEREPAQMGGLPALAFGFVHTDQAEEVVERYRYVAAFDKQFIYWFGMTYDPAHVSTFVSDEAVTEFAPVFRQIAAALPIPPPSRP